jgi:polyisoprenoid-binding protein YceI
LLKELPMTRALSAVAFVALLGLTASAADEKYTLTGENTKVTFVGTKKNGKHEGGFKKVAGTATVADGKPETLQIQATIDCDSLYSDNEKLTAHLKNPDFFAVKDNPTATFKTTKVEKTPTGYTITGDLTLLGKTKPVTMPATVAVAGDTLTLTSEFKINRFDWGMTYGKGMVDETVSLKLNVAAKK